MIKTKKDSRNGGRCSSLPSLAGSAFFACKVAFSLPDDEDALTDGIVSKLMDISPGNTVVETVGGPCSPPLLIIDTDDLPTPEWVSATTDRINVILQNNQVRHGAKGQNDE